MYYITSFIFCQAYSFKNIIFVSLHNIEFIILCNFTKSTDILMMFLNTFIYKKPTAIAVGSGS